MTLPHIPTSFLGLFLLSTALSLAFTFAAVAGARIARRLRGVDEATPHKLR